ncbi:MAG: CapA family protein [Anaerolineales bacterium]|nr:CapA family protein [Anaerolineales bacterium]
MAIQYKLQEEFSIFKFHQPHRVLYFLIVCTLIFTSCVPNSAKPATPVPAPMAYVDIPKPRPGETIPLSSPTTSTLHLPTVAPATYTPNIPNADVLNIAMWVPPYLSETMGKALDDSFRSLFVSNEATANIRLEVGEVNVVSQWVYALVTPFSSSIMQGRSSSDLLAQWQGQTTGTPLLMDQNTHGMFTALWGTAGANVQVVAKNDLIDYAWAHQPSLAIVPFDDLDPRWKVLPVDGLSPIHKNFDLGQYRLKIPISLISDPGLVALIQSNFAIPASNYDPQKMTVVAMTGVTALVRATAFTMERRGILYPAEDIRNWLINADITHISNEVPFAVGCPYPNPTQEEIRFCSADKYIQLLEDVSTDVVELTGDHFSDWGTEAMVHTLEMYKQRNWPYYGGGTNLAEGRKALLLENHGNRIAFIGCNAKGGSFAQASDTQPGAAVCDMDWMASEIQRLKVEGYLVIATFQHLEYYTYYAQPDQQEDFRQMAQAGADIVSGSQAHQPQGMEFLNGSFIHYGLGNLFFDQYSYCDACRQGMIDLHVFYNGRYISTELLPIEFVDYARSRPMTLEEENEFFQVLFGASGWR